MRTSMFLLLLVVLVMSGGIAQTASDGKISGVVYADYFYNVARDSGFSALSNTAITGPRDLHGFKLRRLYFTYDKPIADVFSMRFRLEVDESANTSNGKIGTFVKDAYLKWKGIFAESDLVLGIQPTPAFEVSEGVWGYRSIEKTLLDLLGIVSSRDQGVSLNGTIIDGGMLKYKVMYGNGSSNSPETNRYKRYYARFESAPVQNLIVTAYADLAARSPLSTPAGSVGNNTITVAGFAGYREKSVFTLGVEGFLQSTKNGYAQAGTYATRSGLGLSAFGSVTLSPELVALARLDSFDPNTSGSATGDSRLFALAGIDWRLAGDVSIIPNILLETYENVAGVSVDPSVTARVTVTYTF